MARGRIIFIHTALIGAMYEGDFDYDRSDVRGPGIMLHHFYGAGTRLFVPMSNVSSVKEVD